MSHRPHACTRIACNADQCSQGRKPCPTPQACEVAQDLADKPATTLEIVGYIGLLAAAVAAAILLVILASGA